jgi:hypothetical protein
MNVLYQGELEKYFTENWESVPEEYKLFLEDWNLISKDKQ